MARRRPPSNIERAAERYRRELAALESTYLKAVGPARRRALLAIRDAHGRFARSLEVEGVPEDVTRRWVTNHDEYRRFVTVARRELGGFAEEAVQAIRWRVAEAGELGTKAAEGLATVAMDGASTIDGVFGQVNVGAVRELVGQVSPESPLRSLPGVARDASERMGRELVRGVVNGTHSRVVGRRIAAVADMPAHRAATIARTEMHRAHRESSRVAYQQNTAVDEWVWHADLGARTCAACWAMHGSVHDTNTPMGTHPNCRCVMRPRVSQAARDVLGLGDEVVLPTGAERFATLARDEQRAILGPGRLAQYEAGTPLTGFVKETTSPDWGITRTVRPVGS